MVMEAQHAYWRMRVRKLFFPIRWGSCCSCHCCLHHFFSCGLVFWARIIDTICILRQFLSLEVSQSHWTTHAFPSCLCPTLICLMVDGTILIKPDPQAWESSDVLLNSLKGVIGYFSHLWLLMKKYKAESDVMGRISMLTIGDPNDTLRLNKPSHKNRLSTASRATELLTPRYSIVSVISHQFECYFIHVAATDHHIMLFILSLPTDHNTTCQRIYLHLLFYLPFLLIRWSDR